MIDPTKALTAGLIAAWDKAATSDATFATIDGPYDSEVPPKSQSSDVYPYSTIDVDLRVDRFSDVRQYWSGDATFLIYEKKKSLCEDLATRFLRISRPITISLKLQVVK